jgi:hypothetical protein
MKCLKCDRTKIIGNGLCGIHYNIDYYQKHKDKIRQEYIEHREERILKQKQQNEKNKDKKIVYMKKWYIKNRDKCREFMKKYYKENKEKLNNDMRKHWVKNKDKYNKISKQYYEENKEKINKQKYLYKKEMIKNNPMLKFIDITRDRVSKAFIYNTKSKRTKELLGCDMIFARQYIETQFYDKKDTNEKMSWNNHGLGPGKWQIHHIKPISTFDLINVEEQLKAFHYTNCKPLWYEDHLDEHKQLEQEEILIVHENYIKVI